jgi:hypothetical protein
MTNELLARRRRSYDRTLVKFEALASKSEDYKLSADEEVEFDKLSNTLEKKHQLVMKAL